MANLPPDIAEQAERIAEYARARGTRLLPGTIFEMLRSEEISQVAAYGGFPKRYPHWRFGMEYERLRKQHKLRARQASTRWSSTTTRATPTSSATTWTSITRPSSPTSTPTATSSRTTSGSRKTNRRMMDEMANHATRVRRYIERLRPRARRIADRHLPEPWRTSSTPTPSSCSGEPSRGPPLSAYERGRGG